LGGSGEDRYLLSLRPGLAEIVGIVGGGAVDEVAGRGVQALIARVHLDVHHIPAFEVDITCFPAFALLIAFEYKTALLCSNEDQYFFTHKTLLCETEKMF
jgi:hypothetical protein